MDTTTTTVMSMASVISTVGDVFEGAVGWAATVGNTVANTPLLLFGVVLSFVGVGITLFKRMLNV